METLVVYSRRGCHLCEVLIEELLPLVEGRLALEVRDIDSDPAWRATFSADVPVVEFADEIVCRHFLDRKAIAGILRG
ncbi:MAG: glutaredoxin family protein [Gammaproteobacteria bacterium]|nr:glutaredoxin family protein [Gammaproteobacteria bacterium]NNF48897.1 glutaredoxin family protein [Woeseiaceae bacterium]MBT8095020.1 glutaredoxin family protein [Gammaproteobacteria bacterium]MBT8104690.1 glutaredoxin family protein [Gammaproteobacteria bacterium]NNK24704.1 glutaredoxin family protein [Woeseiaceae bacterium]